MLKQSISWRYCLLIIQSIVLFVLGPLNAAAQTAAGSTGIDIDATCNNAINLPFKRPIVLSEDDKKRLRELPKLKVTIVGNAPPLSFFNPDTQGYQGIAIDVFCSIARAIDLDFQFQTAEVDSLAQAIDDVQNKKVDLFLPLSHTPWRADLGHFTEPYYQSLYAVITRRDTPTTLTNLADFADRRVGYIEKSAIERYLKETLPPEALHPFKHIEQAQTMYGALQKGDLDALIVNKNFFREARYQHDLFDLERRQILYNEPRNYGFYLPATLEHAFLTELFDRHLLQIDTAPSYEHHELSEQHLIERYLVRIREAEILKMSSLLIGLVTLFLFWAWYRSRNFSRVLAENQVQIEQQRQALQEANSKLEKLSLTDSLTDVANRRHFDQTLDRELRRAKRFGKHLSLLLLDLDHFKAVNDLYGHVTGDDYLRQVADILKNRCQRSHDLVARFGGEEFICLLPGTTMEQAFRLAEEIRHDIIQAGLPNRKSPLMSTLTTSCGIATYTPGSEANSDQLILAADAQLYKAKNSGRNQTQSTML